MCRDRRSTARRHYPSRRALSTDPSPGVALFRRRDSDGHGQTARAVVAGEAARRRFGIEQPQDRLLSTARCNQAVAGCGAARLVSIPGTLAGGCSISVLDNYSMRDLLTTWIIATNYYNQPTHKYLKFFDQTFRGGNPPRNSGAKTVGRAAVSHCARRRGNWSFARSHRGQGRTLHC